MGMELRQGGAAATEDARIQRYRGAERRFWNHCGLEPKERFIELNSPAARLRVLEVGSGEAILFVHGTAGAGPVWAPIAKELEGFRCFFLDRPGWGLSSAIDYSRSEYKTLVADVLTGTLDALGVEKAHVIGGSIGNLWALRLAQARPSRVERVVLMGGGPLVSGIEVPPFIKLLSSPLGAVMARLPEKPARVLSIVRGNGHGASLDAGRMDEFIEWRVALGRETASLRHERDMVRSIVEWRRGSFRPGLLMGDEEVAGIEPPTLLVYGTEDPVGSVERWKRFVALLPQGELRVVDGSGHMPWLDDPGRVGGFVRGFLRH